MYQDRLKLLSAIAHQIPTQVESLLEVVDLEVKLNSLDILRELLEIRTDFTFTLPDVDQVKLTAQNSDFLCWLAEGKKVVRTL